jgi:hypothetical protein
MYDLRASEAIKCCTWSTGFDLEHLEYATAFVILKIIPIMLSMIKFGLIDKRLEIAPNTQKSGNVYNPVQKMFLSIADNASVLFDSKIHSVVPSGFALFHHRRFTSSRPVIFLTVQKSSDKNRVVITNVITVD